jgi:CDK-activating kinase assembly factor MAT1
MISWTCARTTTIWRKSKTSVRFRRLSYSLSNLALAFNLINDIDIPQTEARIAAYRAENAALIELNIQREEQNTLFMKEQEEFERQQREQRALEARREEEEEREEKSKRERELIDKLETSNKDASKLVAKSLAEAQKRNNARTQSSNLFASNSRLLRSRAAQSIVIPDVPHVALQDDWYAYEDKYEVKSSYHDPVSEAVRKDKEGIMRAGGYRVEEAWERALRSAVAGLDIPPLGVPDDDIVMVTA